MFSLIQTIVLLDGSEPKSGSQERGSFKTSKKNIALAQKLADQILKRSSPRLPLETKWFLSLVEPYAEKRNGRFSQKAISKHLGWKQKEVKLHIERLVKTKYLQKEDGLLLVKNRSLKRIGWL
jgi:hypothetical protein